MRIRLFGQYIHASITVLAAIEALVFFIVLLAAVSVNMHGSPLEFGEFEDSYWPRALLFSGVMITSLLAFGLYSSRQRARALGLTVRIVLAVGAGILVTSIVFSLIPQLSTGSGVLMGAGAGAFGGLIISRLAFSQFVDENIFKRRVLVYGAGRNAAAIANLRRRADRRGFTLVGFVQPEGEQRAVSAERMLDASGGLSQLCEKLDVDEVVVAMDDRRRGFPIPELLECRLNGIDITELLTFLERETGRVRIDVLNPSWMIFGEGFRRDPLRLFSSRLLDLVASSVILTIGLPVMLATAIAIKIEDGWRAPVLYRQERVGLGGRTFRLLKFRSMQVDAEIDGQPRWASKRDSRVTRVGAVIRKFRIDELPQILNVLRGDMSFVGPRPERPEFVSELSQKIPYYVQRHCVKPGITGWAQLCYPYGSSEQDALEKLQYDLYYIKNNSLLFDLTILVQTAEVVFMGQGAR
ncbi:MAG TPA: TIGR03013 family XrtA/PEP-CTERM system glycosyltransferase [Steroidobacteraceae bacterium]